MELNVNTRSIYLAPSDTHPLHNIEEISPYDVAQYLIDHQGTSIPSKVLCEIFIGNKTDSSDTLMRQLIEAVTNDRLYEKIIIASTKGFLHPKPDQFEMVNEYINKLEKMARSLFYRSSSIKRRVQLDNQMKERLGKNDSAVFQAFLRENDEIVSEELKNAPKAKRMRQDPYEITDGGQVRAKI